MKSKIYQGTTKTLYHSEEDHTLIMSFDDSIKKSNQEIISVDGKGIINNSISSYIMTQLEMIGVENHFIQKNNMRQQLVQFVDVYPIQINICTIACGRYVTDFGIENGFVFESPIIDFKVKNKDLNYPVVNCEQILSFGWLNKTELETLKIKSMRIYDFLSGLFTTAGVRLVDISLEFGRVFNGEDFVTMLTDEISPDTCKLWDMETNEKLSYEIAEENVEKVLPAYQKILDRLNILIKL